MVWRRSISENPAESAQVASRRRRLWRGLWWAGGVPPGWCRTRMFVRMSFTSPLLIVLPIIKVSWVRYMKMKQVKENMVVLAFRLSSRLTEIFTTLQYCIHQTSFSLKRSIMLSHDLYQYLAQSYLKRALSFFKC